MTTWLMLLSFSALAMAVKLYSGLSMAAIETSIAAVHHALGAIKDFLEIHNRDRTSNQPDLSPTPTPRQAINPVTGYPRTYAEFLWRKKIDFQLSTGALRKSWQEG